MTYAMEHKQDNRIGLFLLILALLLVGIVSVGISYQAIPNTDHANSAHLGEKWHVDNIATYFDAGHCKPKKFDCGTKEIHRCELPEGGTIALIIGKLSGKKVTGYKATTEYWDDQTRGCNYAGYAY
jgi:hypothetical protein